MILTVTDPRVNSGFPTNIALAGTPGQRPSRAEIETAIGTAAGSIAGGSRDFPAHRSVEEAVAVAQSGQGAPSNDTASPIQTPQPSPGPTDESPDPGTYDYWGGGVGKKSNEVLRGLPAAPDDSYYRLVDSDEEAQAAIEAGEKPLHGHPDLSEETLTRLQQLQYELPGRLYGINAKNREIDPIPNASPMGGVEGQQPNIMPNWYDEFGHRRMNNMQDNADEVRGLLGAPHGPDEPRVAPRSGAPDGTPLGPRSAVPGAGMLAAGPGAPVSDAPSGVPAPRFDVGNPTPANRSLTDAAAEFLKNRIGGSAVKALDSNPVIQPAMGAISGSSNNEIVPIWRHLRALDPSITPDDVARLMDAMPYATVDTLRAARQVEMNTPQGQPAGLHADPTAGMAGNAAGVVPLAQVLPQIMGGGAGPSTAPRPASSGAGGMIPLDRAMPMLLQSPGMP